MLGMFNVLPFLKGWAYKRHKVERNNVIRGADPVEVFSKNETGLVYAMIAASDDCYGTLIAESQGADLQVKTDLIYPELFRSLGLTSQDPAGWVSVYRRNNPASTAGVYVGQTTAGFQGSTFPYKPSIALRLYLPPESTQETAYIQGIADVVAITNIKAFIRSLRLVQEAKPDLYVNPDLLSVATGIEVKT